MKTLIVAMFMFSAISISAEKQAAPVPYCQCQGGGIPLPNNTTKTVGLRDKIADPNGHFKGNETHVRGRLERLIYEWEWYWILYNHFLLK
jgi:hypothetical protein